MRLRSVLQAAGLIFTALTAVALWSTEAEAYPQFQFSTGAARCSDCHYSPAGGGLINAYGRAEAGDTISAYGGDGSFLHGAWTPPDWVDFGADLRLALLGKDVGDDARGTFFPMQGDTYVRFAFGQFSAYLNVGPRAAPREPRQSFGQRFVSREHCSGPIRPHRLENNFAKGHHTSGSAALDSNLFS